MRSTVLGGGGFLGRHITRMLLARGDSVRIFNRRSYPELAALGAECLQGDILDLSAVKAACAGSDTVFHTVAICNLIRDQRRYHQVNVGGTERVLEACLATGVRQLVYTSTPSVVIGNKDIIAGNESLPYPTRHLAPYPRSKALAEQMVLAANQSASAVAGVKLRTCALRPHLIWGPGDPHIIPKLFQGALEGRLRLIGTGTNEVSITYVENAAHGHLLAADELRSQGRCAGKAYFINDTAPVLLWDWINSLLTSLQIPPVTSYISHRLAWLAGLTEEVFCRFFPFRGAPQMTRFVVDQLARSHSFSHAAATRDFGYQPLVNPEEGMHQLLQWSREIASQKTGART